MKRESIVDVYVTVDRAIEKMGKRHAVKSILAESQVGSVSVQLDYGWMVNDDAHAVYYVLTSEEKDIESSIATIRPCSCFECKIGERR